MPRRALTEEEGNDRIEQRRERERFRAAERRINRPEEQKPQKRQSGAERMIQR